MSTVSDIQTAIISLEQHNPDALKLGELVSLAVRIEPELLRAVRLELTTYDASAEADLWLSSLVETRTAEWIAFAPDAARTLRLALATDRRRLAAAHTLITKLHKGAPATIILEEELVWLALSNPREVTNAFESRLHLVLGKLLENPSTHKGLAHWFAGAAQRLPEQAQATEAYALLYFVSSGLLNGRLINAPEPGLLPIDTLAGVLPTSIPKLRLWATLTEHGLTLHPEEARGFAPLELPRTNPLLFELRQMNEPHQFIRLRRGETKTFKIKSSEVELRTAAGDAYRLRRRQETISGVFLSYRQIDDEQMQRVRAFAERLRDCEIEVVFDQFFLDAYPGGPNEGWVKWSADHALRAEYLLIMGTRDWFQCFENKQPPGTGLGSACEAHDIRARMYEAAGGINNIRIVLFNDADTAYIPGLFRPYHRFHAERDFANIVRWLGGTLFIDTPRTSIPHNLPSLQPFFGREDELRWIADALDPESRTWGAVIDGPGGMGKTSLAVRAAYDVSPDAFERVVFVSLKSRELDDDGVRDLSGFLIMGLAELLNELARELGHAEIAKAPEDQRPRLLLEALRGTRTLLVLDNLESLIKRDRDILFTFVNKLPLGCKAILTTRVRISSAAQELILQGISLNAALAMLAKLAESNHVLARASEAERVTLFNETGGTPLLLRWAAGQIGRGSCLTPSDAIAYLRSCPEGNDPLEYIFGDLVEDFSENEIGILGALTHFTLPANADHVAELAECSEADADRALRSLVNRSLVVPSEELKTFALVPFIADFLQKKKTDVVAYTGHRLEKRVYALVTENGFKQFDRFPMLDAAWPTIAAALPRFMIGPNDLLQTVSSALKDFLEFTGRWDEWLGLSKTAENRAVEAGDSLNAGWRAYEAGWIYGMRGQHVEVLACADRAEAYWKVEEPETEKRALAMRLRGGGHNLQKQYLAAITAYREAVEILRISDRKEEFALTLNDLADAERLSGDLDAAERDYHEALQIIRTIDSREGEGYIIGNLAVIALERKDWSGAEGLAREALSLSEKIGRQELIGLNCDRLANAVLRQGKKPEALRYAEQAVEIFRRLGSPNLASVRKTLAECES